MKHDDMKSITITCKVNLPGKEPFEHSMGVWGTKTAKAFAKAMDDSTFISDIKLTQDVTEEVEWS